MEFDLFIIFILLHIFALWPVCSSFGIFELMLFQLTLFYCKSKRKRKLRETGNSCESLLNDKSMVKTAVLTHHRPLKKISTTPSKVLPNKPIPEEKKTESKKEATNTEEKVCLYELLFILSRQAFRKLIRRRNQQLLIPIKRSQVQERLV